MKPSLLIKSFQIVCIGLALAVCAGSGWSQEATGTQQEELQRYTVTDLGALGGTYSYAYSINSLGVVAGGAATASQTNGVAQTAFVWYRGHLVNLGTLGGADCPKCSSEGAAAVVNGSVAILSETAEGGANTDEDFCGFGTHHQCLAGMWKDGTLTALPTLPGGKNSQAVWANNRGQIVGFSENGVIDQNDNCSNATPYQKMQFEGVVWQPDGQIRELLPLPGDTVSFAFGLNDNGQAVGVSGLCNDTSVPPFTAGPQAPHAVLWEKDGSATDLGSLVSNGAINIPGGINNRGHVAGGSQSSGGAPHAFLWTRETGMQDLGTLPGDFFSTAPCCQTINDRDEVVGLSFPGPQGSGRAFVWTKEQGMQDLNGLIPADSGWYLQEATSINDFGQIVGWGTNSKGQTHAFVLTPVGFRPMEW
jgi:probable HAF family extracellular repeat protein